MKRRREGQKVYLNKLELRTSLNWVKKQTFRFRRHREWPLEINKNRSTSSELIVKYANFRDKEKIPKQLGWGGGRSLTNKGRKIRLAAELSMEN